MGLFKTKKNETTKSAAKQETAKTAASDSGAAEAEKEKKPGFFASKWQSVKTGAGKLAKKGKKAIGKEPDEMSDTEFDTRLQELEADGETGYASRYYALIEELKKMPSLTALSKQAEPDDVAEAVSENPQLDDTDKAESNAANEKLAAPSGEGGEKMTAEEEAVSETGRETNETEQDKTAEGGSETAESGNTEEGGSLKDKAMALKDDAMAAGTSGMNAFASHKRSKALEQLSTNADIATSSGRQISYMKGQADIETSNSGFDTASNVVNLVNKAIGKFGSSSLAAIAGKVTGFINTALSFGKDFMAKRLEKKSVKNGLKGLLGGTEVYKQMKSKYKLHGGDMRRAIRIAANRSSVQELINADKDKLSEDYAQNVKDGTGSADDYMGLAGGRDAASIKKAMGGAG